MKGWGCETIHTTAFMTLSMSFRLLFNPYLTNGLFHHYYLDDSTFFLRGFRWDFYFLFHVSVKFLQANRKAQDGTPCSAALHLGLFCLPMSHKRDAITYSKNKGTEQLCSAFVFATRIVQFLFLNRNETIIIIIIIFMWLIENRLLVN